MAVKKKVSRTKEKVGRAIAQAKESLKLLEVLEKEAVAKARSFVRLPVDRKKLTSERVLASLKKLGVATRDELTALQSRVEKLEAELALQQHARGQEAAFIKESGGLPHS